MTEDIVVETRNVRISRVAIGQLVQLSWWPNTDGGKREIADLLVSGGDARAVFAPSPNRLILYSACTVAWPAPDAMLYAEGGAVLDLSQSREGFVISGDGAEQYLQTLFPLDLALEAFAIGGGCATIYHDTPVFLIRTAAGRFHCLVARSLARDFAAVLSATSKE